MKALILALTSITLSVGAQFALKFGMMQVKNSRPLPNASMADAVSPYLNAGILLGFLLYGSSALIWLAVLSEWDVSKAYPLVGIGFIATLFVGAAVGESVTLIRIAGVALIACGVLLITRS